MWMMLQQDTPEDFVIGTGQQHSVKEFAKLAFSHVDLDYKKFVKIEKKLIRPTEVDTLLADYSKAEIILKWKPEISFEKLVIEMVDSDIKFVKKEGY